MKKIFTLESIYIFIAKIIFGGIGVGLISISIFASFVVIVEIFPSVEDYLIDPKMEYIYSESCPADDE